MFSHFNTVFIEIGENEEVIKEENDHLALGIGGRFVLSTRIAVLFEYIPVFGSRSDGTRDEMGIALNLETGGHVFQLFLKTSTWLTEQHAISRNRDRFQDLCDQVGRREDGLQYGGRGLDGVEA